MIIIENKYAYGDIVFLKTDVEQQPRIVTCIIACPAGDILYELSCGTTSSKHYDFEITIEKTVMV
jgi:hypothetical protein